MVASCQERTRMVASYQEYTIMVASCQECTIMVGSCQERIRMVAFCQEPVRSLSGRPGRLGKSKSCQDRQEASRILAPQQFADVRVITLANPINKVNLMPNCILAIPYIVILSHILVLNF